MQQSCPFQLLKQNKLKNMLSHLKEHAGRGCVAPVMHLAAPVELVFVFVIFRICVLPFLHLAAQEGNVFVYVMT